MTRSACILTGAALLGLAGCVSSDTTRDFGIDSTNQLDTMPPATWVDPNGCDHWIIDDGVEGYMSPRLDPTGRPVCRDGAVPNTSNVRRVTSGVV